MFGPFGHTQGFYYIIIKTPFYLLKIEKSTNKKYPSNSNFVTYFY